MRFSFSYFFYSFINFYYFPTIIFIIPLFLCQYNLNEMSQKYYIIKQLDSGKFFIILENGIYIYNLDLSPDLQIYNFENTEKIKSDYDFKLTVISEYRDKSNNLYFFCFIKGLYLFIYNNNEFNITKINLEYIYKGDMYNLVPYEYDEDNIEFIISFINYDYESNGYIMNLYLYKIYLQNGTISNNVEYYIDEKHCGNQNMFSIDYYYISCQKGYEYSLICFYSSKKDCDEQYTSKLASVLFNITNDFSSFSEKQIISSTEYSISNINPLY